MLPPLLFLGSSKRRWKKQRWLRRKRRGERGGGRVGVPEADGGAMRAGDQPARAGVNGVLLGSGNFSSGSGAARGIFIFRSERGSSTTMPIHEFCGWLQSV